MKERIKIIFAIASILFSGAYFFSPFGDRLNSKTEYYAEMRFGSGTNISTINTGITTSGGTIASGLNVDITLTGGVFSGGSISGIIEQSDEEKYIQYKESGNFRSFFPPKQNRIGGDYATNTQLMNAYLSNNTFQFFLPEEVYTGYLYIRLKKPTTSGIFIYRYGSNKNGYAVSGDLDKDKSLINSETELLYKLDDIPYIRFYDKESDTYNRLSQMKVGTNNNFIAGFVRDYEGTNKIEEMTIAWE